MSLKSKRLIPILSFLLLSAPAFAGIGIGAEPYIGYGVAGSYGSGVSATSDSYTSFAVGAKAVIKIEDLIFVGPAFDYLPSLGYPGPTSSSSLKLGLIAGVQLPIPFRLWAGYNFIDNMNYSITTSGGTLTGQISGSGWRFGAGYKVLPFLSLNAEYLITNSGTSTITSSVQSTSSTISSTGKVVLVSVSMPF